MTWLIVWTRAVIAPAWRRAAAVWAGCAIVGVVIFGPNGMRPRDLTRMAIDDPKVGLVLGAIWLLGFLPTARMIVRPRQGAYLKALPHPTRWPIAIAVGALLGMQLPWVLLWLVGEGPRGGLVIAATTAAAVGLAALRAPSRRPRWPGWRGPARALVAIHLRARSPVVPVTSSCAASASRPSPVSRGACSCATTRSPAPRPPSSARA